MKRIAIFQSDLRVGGIQKALVNILNQIDYSRCEVELFLFDEDRFFEPPAHKNLTVRYEKPYPFLNRLVYFGLMRRFARRVRVDGLYDVAVDFNSYRNECAVNALSVPAKKRVMWIHNDVEIKKRSEPKYRVLWHFFKGKLPLFDEYAAVSPGIVDGFRRSTGITDRPITAIPNQIDTAEIFEKAELPVDFQVDAGVYNLCTMGHICHQKGFDILMDIFADVRRERRDIHLYLLGDGPDRAKLERQIAALGLQDAVTFLGRQSNPFPYLDRMDGFVLTSRYEGQGLVLWEAKTLGLELFMAAHLARYNPGLPGTENIGAALKTAQRREKRRDDLADYNAAIKASLQKVLELEEPET